MKPSYGTDMGEFRILVSVQTCLLAGLGGKGSRKWLNLQYPIDNLGAATQLEGVPSNLRPSALHHIMSEFGLASFGLNCVETLLCETAINRNNRIHDYVLKGQSMFRFNSEGRPIFREFSTSNWKCAFKGEPVNDALE
jgi:hypothetical protein